MYAYHKGTIVYKMKLFYLSQKVTVIGAVNIKEVVELMTINNSMATMAFKVFIEHFFLC